MKEIAEDNDPSELPGGRQARRKAERDTKKKQR
jgi:hypothetical protein